MKKLKKLKIINRFDMPYIKGFILYSFNDENLGVRVSDVCKVYNLSESESDVVKRFIIYMKSNYIYTSKTDVFIVLPYLDTLQHVIEYYIKLSRDITENQQSIINSFNDNFVKKIKYFLLDERNKNTRVGNMYQFNGYILFDSDILKCLFDFVTSDTYSKEVTNDHIKLLEHNAAVLTNENKKLEKKLAIKNKEIEQLKLNIQELQYQINSLEKDVTKSFTNVMDISSWSVRVEDLRKKILKSGKYKNQITLDSHIFGRMTKIYNIDWKDLKDKAIQSNNYSGRFTKYNIVETSADLRKLYEKILTDLVDKSINNHISMDKEDKEHKDPQSKHVCKDLSADKMRMFPKRNGIFLNNKFYSLADTTKEYIEKTDELAELLEKTSDNPYNKAFDLLYSNVNVDWDLYAEHYCNITNCVDLPTRKTIICNYVHVFDHVITVLNTLIKENQ